MTVTEIKNETKERFTINRYKAMPAYCVVFFIVVNIAVVAAALFALTKALNLPLAVSWIFFCYGGLLLLLVVFLSGPFSYSMVDFFMRAYKESDVTPALKFDGFNKLNFAKVVLTYLLHAAFTFLFTCLLIVPGIIYAVRTSMTFYLMRANPKLKYMAALKTSNKIMKGHSVVYFKLCLSFLGWFLLGILTLGSGFIYVMPYFNACKTVFYKRELQKDTTVFKSESAPKSDNGGVYTESIQSEDTVVVSEQNVQSVTVEPVQTVVVESVPVADSEQARQADDISSANAVEGEDDGAAITVTPIEAVPSGEVEILSSEPIIQNEEIIIEPVKVAETAPTPPTSRVEPKEMPKEKERPQPQPTVSPIAAERKETSAPKSDVEEKSNTAKEAIRQRIEQLKRERDKHASRPQRPVRKERPAVKSSSVHTDGAAAVGQQGAGRAKVRDEFGPEKIDVEIVEED